MKIQRRPSGNPLGRGGAPPTITPDITRDEVAHLARLARFAVTEDELDLFAGQLDVILGSVARVSEVAARHPAHLPRRADDQRLSRRRGDHSLPRAAVLAGAPDVEDDKFRVPADPDEDEA